MGTILLRSHDVFKTFKACKEQGEVQERTRSLQKAMNRKDCRASKTVSLKEVHKKATNKGV